MNNLISCRICAQLLPENFFYKSNRHKSGIRSECKKCFNANGAKYQKKRRGQRSFYWQQYKAKNYQVILEKDREYRNKNKDAIQVRAKEWRLANKERKAIAENKRRALKTNNGIFTVSIAELKKLRNSPCAYCSRPAPSCIDHVVPLSRGGVDGIGNYLPACRPCNTSKGDKFLFHWKKVRGW